MYKFSLISLLILMSISISAQNLISTREQAVQMLTNLRKIHTPEGIDTLQQIELNKEKQWISIKGRNRDNPILLFIHGGPASPIMPISWTFQSSWEDYFTVVQWDQRVTGKNWATADTVKARNELGAETIIKDGVELVNWLCKRYKKDKIFILGLSWGTMIGTHISTIIPEKIYAYIGVGQVYHANNEDYLYSRLLELAKKYNNTAALEELKSIQPYPHIDEETPITKMLVTRKWASIFNGGWYGKPSLELYYTLPQLSPDYNENDLKFQFQSMAFGSRFLVDDMQRATSPMNFKVPIFILMGRYDLYTPYAKAKIYFDNLKAPSKKFITYERSAHFPMIEEPGRFLITLVNDIRPLAGKVKDYTIDP
ncbi:alpha/beta hydrolase [Flavihumibacter rivuli]|uniref:alpha/beta fold hydrolase n=1 Tax=Flavihumibacter rivuli TaxID=2838156 RepID=UPI001BDDE021|nr:alpha/beta hydrolase [Flavihumibacter rivuli]ULQ57127.1 alpha/beta hydrolase [Flavihumibacter rivuli]